MKILDSLGNEITEYDRNHMGAGYFGGNGHEEYNATWILRPGLIYGLNYD